MFYGILQIFTKIEKSKYFAGFYKDFQDSPDDEEDTRSSQEYMNGLEEEYQEKSSFKPKYQKVLQKGASAPNSSLGKNKGLIAEMYEWDEEEVSLDDNEMIEVKAFMALADEERVSVGKESAKNGEWVKISMKKKKILGIDQLTEDTSSSGLKDLIFVKSLAYNSNMSTTSGNKPRLSKAEDFTLPNHDTGKVLPVKSQINTTDPSVAVTDSSATDYDLADESLVCSTPLPPLEKLVGSNPFSGPKTIKLILKSNSTFKAEALKGVTLKEPSLGPAKDNRGTSDSKAYSAPADKLKNVLFCKKCKRTDHRTCDHAEFMSSIKTTQHLTGYNDHLSDDCVYYPICELYGSYDHDTHSHNMIISLRRGIKPRNPQHVTKNYETCGSNIHTITDHNDIEWFKKGDALQAKKAGSNKIVSLVSSSRHLSLRGCSSQSDLVQFKLVDPLLSSPIIKWLSILFLYLDKLCSTFIILLNEDLDFEIVKGGACVYKITSCLQLLMHSSITVKKLIKGIRGLVQILEDNPNSATWDDRQEIVEANDSSFVGISMRSLGSSISMSLICCYSSLISLDNPVIFEGSSFSSVVSC
ncbi:hypothetical protein Tco_0692962 [Tanacetum coccineum]